MSKIKYYYNPESCKYERLKFSFSDFIFNSIIYVFSLVLVAGVLLYVYMKIYDSPEELLLKKENESLKLYNKLIGEDLNKINEKLLSLQDKDDKIYRVIYGVDQVSSHLRNGGVGGAEKDYRNLINNLATNNKLITDNFTKIEQIKNKINIQEKSFNEIMSMATDKEKMLASLPSIQPVSIDDLRGLTSGFGIRIDPINKYRKMHFGIDFSLKVGTPIYAVANGVVSLRSRSDWGYGNQIEINHGFGYKTKYAHLSESLVKKGQKVKRGDLIGYSGNSGKSTAPHLHYEVHLNNKPINPVHYFNMNLTPSQYEEVLRLASIENQALGSY